MVSRKGIANGSDEFFVGEWFCEELDVLFLEPFIGDDSTRVARNEDDLQRSYLLFEPQGEFLSVDSGHPNITDEDPNFCGVAAGEIECFVAVFHDFGAIAVGL